MRKFQFFAIIVALSAALIPWTAVHAQPGPDTVLLKPTTRPPVVVDVQSFGTWTVKCTKGTPQTLLPGVKVSEADKQELRDCRAATSLNMNKSPLLPVRVIMSIIAKRTKVRILTFTPPRFALTNLNGPILKIGAKSIALKAMRRCVPLSCASFNDVPISELAAIENAKTIALVMPDLPGAKAVEFNVPSSGLGPALERVRKVAPQS